MTEWRTGKRVLHGNAVFPAGSAGAGKERTWSEAISILLNIMNMANRISVPAEAYGFVSPWNR